MGRLAGFDYRKCTKKVKKVDFSRRENSPAIPREFFLPTLQGIFTFYHL
jgi:hypothetical protein